MSATIDLEEDTLFLACTRPAMIGGVTMEAMGVNMIFTTILFIVAGSVAYVLVGLVFHVIFKAIVKHDHNMFRVLLGWIETRGRARNNGFWGGSSLTPMKLVRRYDERDLGLV
ncbi:type IV secretion system protein VirB3 [Agrobacterium tumefaciens]|uniref:type IV secretion system protein VirB3 n=1 Tax=Agrobacterium tumefaciens TaxID=358 RepID=UPI00224316D9|nr:type IV secretion system protein VirB3 [Agrobacterium tumefaciens]MCW8060575.1 type IV secretion system protein VirB3 [Agrobacterium tumefaciens]MCW8146018.1 type IV secretion system protein VirB3 [Agrobacterium tumefaciens]